MVLYQNVQIVKLGPKMALTLHETTGSRALGHLLGFGQSFALPFTVRRNWWFRLCIIKDGRFNHLKMKITDRLNCFLPFRHVSFHYLSTWWRRCVPCVMIELGMPSLEGKFLLCTPNPLPFWRNFLKKLCACLYTGNAKVKSLHIS